MKSLRHILRSINTTSDTVLFPQKHIPKIGSTRIESQRNNSTFTPGLAAMDIKQSDYSTDLKNPGNDMDGVLDPTQHASDGYLCPRCEKSMSFSEKGEHDDWHFAKDLETQDQGGVATLQPPPPVAPPTQDSKPHPASDEKSGQPPGYAPPSYAPPSHPPPAAGASRAKAIRHHTNQVIEAAKIRAIDEVCCSEVYTTMVQSANSSAARNAERPAESPATIWDLQQ